MCSFITHEFSRLKVHQLGHRDTFVSCNICNDNVQHTLLQLTTHLNMHHSLNGHYCCEKCKFSTRDVGAFLEHLYLHNIAPQAGSADQDLMRHLMAKTAQFRFSCQFCDYKSHRKYIITRHMATIHGEEKSQKNKPKMKDVDPKTVDNSSPRLKHTVTSTVRENNWILSNPERALEETKQFLEKSVAAETGGQTWNEALKTVLSNVPQAITSFSNSENCMISNPGFTNTNKDLTVLMLKNKISVPPDVTTEAIGFKMVEGKKHLVLKVTPAAKQETSDTTKTSLYTAEDMKVPKLTVEKSEKKLKSFPEALCSSKTMGDKKKWSTKVVSPKTVEKKSSPALKLLLKKNPVKEMQWMSQGTLPLLGGGLLNNSHRLEHPQKTLEETQQFLKRALSTENGKKKHTKSKVVTRLSKSEGGFIPNLGHFSTRVNNLSALMVKNKILVPPNCTTEAMGFKMVDGKKHLVLKVTPSDKTEASLHSVETKEDNTLSESCTMSQNSLVVVEKSQPSSKIPPSTITKSNLEYHFENVELPNTNVSFENREGMNNGMDSHVLGGQHCPRVGLPHVSNGAKSDGNDLDQITEDKPDLEGVGTTEAQVIMVSPSPILNYLTSPQGITNWSEIPVHTPDVYSQDFPPNTTLRNGGKQEVFDRICLSPQQNKQRVRGKRQSELSTEDSLEPLSKANKPSSKVVEEKEASPAAAHHWEPGPRDVERTLKLLPLSPTQLITRPRGDQPVVVLNHPDTDIPEVTNIMETVHRYKGEVQKVLLSRETLKAFAGMGCNMFRANAPTNASVSHQRMWPESRKYKVVNAISHSTEPPLRFSCWFCGRVFSDQEVWIGHGQRHLMESTKEWDKLKCEKS
ncbi:unnamed protein product [Oncorhynchus mykiss]|uniref:C2H2-type domain-containing protein n=1 Tax=Oncorhynchus mykiss TaxID=8022 RepID=A0A060WC45_ONCMY|nr:unnamed protein product [Oncorhynchus mykiss]